MSSTRFFYEDNRGQEQDLTLKRKAPKWMNIDCPPIYDRKHDEAKLLFSHARSWGLLLGESYRYIKPLTQEATALVERFLYLCRWDDQSAWVLKRAYRDANRDTLRGITVPFVPTNETPSASALFRVLGSVKTYRDQLDIIEDLARTRGSPTLYDLLVTYKGEGKGWLFNTATGRVMLTPSARMKIVQRLTRSEFHKMWVANEIRVCVDSENQTVRLSA
jgi:hypothetical protein